MGDTLNPICRGVIRRLRGGKLDKSMQPQPISDPKMLPLIKNWEGGGYNLYEKQDPILIMHMGGLGGPGLKMTRMS